MDTFSPLIKAWKQKGITKTNKMLEKKLKVALHLVHSNSFFQKIFLNFSIGGWWGQPMSLFWKLVDETQMAALQITRITFVKGPLILQKKHQVFQYISILWIRFFFNNGLWLSGGYRGLQGTIRDFLNKIRWSGT